MFFVSCVMSHPHVRRNFDRLSVTYFCCNDRVRRVLHLITGPFTHSVGGQTSNGWRLSSSVTLNGRPSGGYYRARQAMTSCCLQSNFSSTAARRATSVTSR